MKAIEDALTELGLPFENPRPGAYLVKLAGQHKLATMTWLIADRLIEVYTGAMDKTAAAISA